MIFFVCTTDGELVQKTAGVDEFAAIRQAVGEPGYDIAWKGLGFAAFVNDMGHVEGLPRNVVGSCVMSSLAMRRVSPLAGPVAITGWGLDPRNEPDSLTLTDDGVDLVRAVYHDIRIVLGQEIGVLTEYADPRWQAAIRMCAEHAASAPTPTVQILTGIEALNYLRGAP